LRAMAKSVGLNILVKNELKGEISVDFHGTHGIKAIYRIVAYICLSYVWEGQYPQGYDD